MSGDYSRSRFDPRKHFHSVLMQQGRVQLDSDWNELAEAFDRRFRAERADTLFRAVVPRRTPDGFRIRLAADRLTIGPGRLYVDGLMAENHGDPGGPQIVDPVLHEPRGKDPIDYAAGQPYFPAAAAPPIPGAPFLVYLDAWQREVTAVEDPDLIEPAIGVDTATRLQTAWRVRLLPDVATPPSPAEFDPLVVPQADDFDPLTHIPPPFWAAATRAPTGRLTTGVDDAAPPDDNPCIIPPSGGFRGLENQLYRVEVHRSGPAGVATFKWSRDNASIAAQVTVADRDAITVSSVGRDAVLRFSAGDWIEILDDVREPDGARGEAGVLRRVVRVDDEARLLELEPDPNSDLTAQFPAATLAARRTRVRRWDQRAAAGVLPIAAGTPIVLELGVTVTFSVDDEDDPTPFRAGDFWTFAARTEGAIVEPLDSAPPRGPHHHFAPLAWVDPTDGRVVDLRVLWPQQAPATVGGDCTHHVRPESHNNPDGFTIQDALDDLRARGGGTICLGRGTYFLTDEALRIDDLHSVTIRGRGPDTVLVRQRPLLPAVKPPEDVPPNAPPIDGDGNPLAPQPGFDDNGNPLAPQSPGLDPQGGQQGPPPVEVSPDPELLRIAESTRITLTDLVLVSGTRDGGARHGVLVDTAADITFERCMFVHIGQDDFDPSPALALRGALVRLTVRDNLFLASAGLAVDARLASEDLEIAGNVFTCRSRGVDLGAGDRFDLTPTRVVVHAGATRIVGNSFTACDHYGVGLGGLVDVGRTVEVAGNTFETTRGGVFTRATHTTITGNTLRGPRGRVVIAAITAAPNLDTPLADALVVANNTIRDYFGGVECTQPARRVIVRDNDLADLTQFGVLVTYPDRAALDHTVEVRGNQLEDIVDRDGQTATITGIGVEQAGHALIADNTLTRIGQGPSGPNTSRIRGVFASHNRDVTLRDNHLGDIGPRVNQPLNPETIALYSENTLSRLMVVNNRVTPATDTETFDQLTIDGVGRAAPLIGLLCLKDNTARARFVDDGFRWIYFGDYKNRALPAFNEMIHVDGNLLHGVKGPMRDQSAHFPVRIDSGPARADIVFVNNVVTAARLDNDTIIPSGYALFHTTGTNVLLRNNYFRPQSFLSGTRPSVEIRAAGAFGFEDNVILGGQLVVNGAVRPTRT